jgi:hypothetical protein
MTDAVFAPLLATLGRHFSLSKSRLMTLAVLICGVAQARTVNLSHIAGHFPGVALHASNYRRLQRFFQHEHLDQGVTAQLVLRILNHARPRHLALDRSNWKLGGRDINVLVLALVTRRFRVPLLWTFLSHQGNSDTGQRIALIQRYLDLFGAPSVELLLADREFIGVDWLEFLCKNNVPFVIRLREPMIIHIAGRPLSFTSLLRKNRRGTWIGRLEGMRTELHFAAMRLHGEEAMIVATNTGNAARAMRDYKKRWAIECMFADCKTRGLNLEDTHITDPAKLEALIGVVALAMAWAYRCATVIKGRGAIGRKTHGRREKSWFRIGLDALRRWLIFDPQRALKAWTGSVLKQALRY